MKFSVVSKKNRVFQGSFSVKNQDFSGYLEVLFQQMHACFEGMSECVSPIAWSEGCWGRECVFAILFGQDLTKNGLGSHHKTGW